jgi:hypothetical protein
MKDAEDEALDDLAKRQGDWGSGYQAKRAAAMDKINSDFDEQYKKSHAELAKYRAEAQPAQDPVECLDCGSNNVGIPATYDSLVNSVKSQLVQEPDLTAVYMSGLYDGKKKKRPWVGLEKSDMPGGESPMFDHEYFIAGMVFASNVLKEKNT